MHINDLLLEPIKKLSFKILVPNKKKWYHGDYKYVTPGIDPTQLILEKINSSEPCMFARYGSTELSCVLAYIYQNSNKSYLKKCLEYFKGDIPAFWFGYKNRTEICSNSGFFPNNKNLITRFCERMIDDSRQLDVFLTWLNGEKYTFSFHPPGCKIISLWDVQPFFSATPWTMSLKSKKVLVIHPYSKSILLQYEKRDLIFNRIKVLPEMDLKTFKAVQTIRNNKSDFKDWFEALNYMKSEIEKIDFDIALIGAGAYGFPLAADIKRMGKQAFHIGGSLQLYFGIRGQRWEIDPNFQQIFNEHWVRPLPEEHPNDFKKGEGSVYW